LVSGHQHTQQLHRTLYGWLTASSSNVDGATISKPSFRWSFN
jgi:hypothetical protein